MAAHFRTLATRGDDWRSTASAVGSQKSRLGGKYIDTYHSSARGCRDQVDRLRSTSMAFVRGTSFLEVVIALCKSVAIRGWPSQKALRTKHVWTWTWAKESLERVITPFFHIAGIKALSIGF